MFDTYHCVETTNPDILWLVCVLVELWHEHKINDADYFLLAASILPFSEE